MGIEISFLNVRRSIFIRATPERVFEEFESFENVAAWFGQGHQIHTFEPGLGGNVRMSVELSGEQRHFGGTIIVWEKNREVTFDDNWDPPNDWPVPTFVTIRLTPLYDGTLVELFHHGFERLGAAAADHLQGYESGWNLRHLTTLRAIVED